MTNIPRLPLIAVGAFIAVGAVNAVGEMITGSPLMDGGSAQASTGQVQTRTATGSWTMPTGGKQGTPYGVPGTMWQSGHHTGMDFQVSTGTPVHAAGNGTVVAAGPGGAYGNQVVIRHGNKLYTQYAHLSELDVVTGAQVKTGQRIGLSGSTGNSTGPHLHFEVRTGPNYGSDINPSTFLSAHVK